MKRTTCLTSLAALLGLLPLAALAQTSDDFEYSDETNHTATITGYTGPGGAVEIPTHSPDMLRNPVATIGDSAFRNGSTITSVTFRRNISAIGNEAFSGCTLLDSIYFEGNSPALGTNSFSAISAQAAVYHPVESTEWGATYGGIPTASWNPNLAYTLTPEDTVTITNYTGPGGVVIIPELLEGNPVTCIGENAFIPMNNNYFFNGSGPITSIDLPNSITNIGAGAFAENAFTQVTISSNLSTIGSNAFLQCTHLTEFIVDEQNPNYSSLDGVLFDKTQNTLIAYPGNKLGAYAIPGSVSHIKEWAFSYNNRLTDINIPNSVTVIEDYTFYDCKNVSNISIPNSVTNIGIGAFILCTNLTNITLPTSLVRLGNAAFGGCASLTSIIIPNGITNIASYTFDQCTSLIDISIPNGITNIGECAFRGCSNLTSITLPNSLTCIEEEAFDECSSLTSITIPNSILSLGDYAFRYCSSLQSIYFKGSPPAVDSEPLDELNDHATIYYLEGTTGWEDAYSGIPTVLWNPKIDTAEANLEMTASGFKFNVTGTNDFTFVIEASTNIVSGTWEPVATNTLSDGGALFTDPQGTNYPSRYYRLTMP